MTPQERQLVADLFERLASLERDRRDPEAERAIADGLARAPNAPYALVQTVLVQDEALKQANARIQALESARAEAPAAGGGFLDDMRESLRGRDTGARGSVPAVGGGASKWNNGQAAAAAAPAYGAAPAESPARGSSFLGTAAAAAAGVIGGSLLFDGMRSLMGGHSGNAFASPHDSPGDQRPTPWGSDASDSGLARDAGAGDVGSGRATGQSGADRAGLFDSGDGADDGDDFADLGDGDFDGSSDA